ncbi:MAG: ATP synthase F1 subunit epsilon [Bacillota bacterium]|nr:ATP synthase F1 subunit epsilon [Bacillota bacterium]
MAEKFKVSVITPDRVFYDGETELIILTGTAGAFAVMRDFQPAVIPLKIGSLKIRNEDGSYSAAACGSGLLTMSPSNEATVLLDSAEWIDEIDLERAIESKKRAEQRLNIESQEVDYVRAKAALQRAINRIKLSEMKK